MQWAWRINPCNFRGDPRDDGFGGLGLFWMQNGVGSAITQNNALHNHALAHSLVRSQEEVDHTLQQ